MINGKYINHIDTKNFAIKTPVLKKIMFDPNLENFEDLDLYLRLKEIIKIKFIPSLVVGHHHINSFIETVRLYFDRGYWTKIIYAKYKTKDNINKDPMFESISFKNFLTFPLWICYQFLRKPNKESVFLLISELSWRAGILWALQKNN